MNAKSLPWISVAVLAVLVGTYPGFYFVMHAANPGILQRKSVELLASHFYKGAFYTHIGFGGLALLIGWLQFSKKLRDRRLRTHRVIGKIYMAAVLLSSIAAMVIALFAFGGPVCTAGFGLLAMAWLFTDIRGYRAIRELEIDAHRAWMIRNYALTFAAVTLRIYLPLATIVMKIDFLPAYRVIAWLCWVPNLFVAEFIIRRYADRMPEAA